MTAKSDHLDLEAIGREYERFWAFLASSQQLKERREQVRAKLAPSLRDEVYREHSVTLYRYRRSRPAAVATPLLLIPSLVNQPWILDFLAGESFVQALLDRGLEVFMLEWGTPTPGQRSFTVAHYLTTYLGRAVRRVLKATGTEALTLAGYCLGGTLALLYAAQDGKQQIKNLVTMVAPVNFEDPGLLSWWSRENHFDVDKVVDTFGNVPASFFAASFPWLVPTSSLTKLRMLYDRHQDERWLESFLGLDLWLTQNTAFPGQVYREFIRNAYQQNLLQRNGAWPLGDGQARLAEVKAAVLCLAAQYDHIAPPQSCCAIKDLVEAECTTREYPTSHLGIALGKDIAGAPTTEYWDDLAQWLAGHD